MSFANERDIAHVQIISNDRVSDALMSRKLMNERYLVAKNTLERNLMSSDTNL